MQKVPVKDLKKNQTLMTWAVNLNINCSMVQKYILPLLNFTVALREKKNLKKITFSFHLLFALHFGLFSPTILKK